MIDDVFNCMEYVQALQEKLNNIHFLVIEIHPAVPFRNGTILKRL